LLKYIFTSQPEDIPMTQPGQPQQSPGQFQQPPAYPQQQQPPQYPQVQALPPGWQQPAQPQWNHNGVYGGHPVKKTGVPVWGWLLIVVIVLGIGITALFVTGNSPIAQKSKGQQVVDLFKSAGLEAEKPSPMKKEDFGPTPQVAIEAIHFYAPSIDNTGTSGGRIMVFSSQKDLEIVKSYYVALGDANRQLFSWVFVKDNVLVQINGALPQSKALQYEAALNRI
jgi:hypothetical protein